VTPVKARIAVFAALLCVAASGCSETFSAVPDVPHAPGTAPAAQTNQGPQPTTGSRWKTVRQERVRVNVPIAWRRVDVNGCDSRGARWAPPDARCGRREGVSFYPAALFEPTYRPGVIRRAETTSIPAVWVGYVYAGDFAVTAFSTDRALVGKLLCSVRSGWASTHTRTYAHRQMRTTCGSS
jgi:hypothetical protein